MAVADLLNQRGASSSASPDLAAKSASPMCRVQPMSRKRATSAVVSVIEPAPLVTTMLRRVHSSMSMVS